MAKTQFLLLNGSDRVNLMPVLQQILLDENLKFLRVVRLSIQHTDKRTANVKDHQNMTNFNHKLRYCYDSRKSFPSQRMPKKAASRTIMVFSIVGRT